TACQKSRGAFPVALLHAWVCRGAGASVFACGAARAAAGSCERSMGEPGSHDMVKVTRDRWWPLRGSSRLSVELRTFCNQGIYRTTKIQSGCLSAW
ncbi:hypothetical protein LEMLEM_LOCUS14242, partial [Lemmus lemmus]